jgi:hypothetical protein
MVFLKRQRWWLLVLSCVCPPVALAAEAGAPEYGIKAAYIYKFMNFVEWPQAGAANGPITLCVAGKDPFGRILDQGFQGKRLGERVIVIQRVSELRLARGCQILFVGPISEKEYRVLQKEIQGAPVLSVSDDVEPPSRDATIVFRNVCGRILFDIRAEAARASGIEISSQLLKLARSTR